MEFSGSANGVSLAAITSLLPATIFNDVGLCQILILESIKLYHSVNALHMCMTRTIIMQGVTIEAITASDNHTLQRWFMSRSLEREMQLAERVCARRSI